ncbi:hypothetical protein PR048_006781 [Dryococelus australis]|uniref:Uncharacterized protein n=1 Tax=Dryococelus australis TaxID=614101 RepID=A0ABQ9ICW5_9NEOP|nr:hypothetical protein PR048_006781 [Dryococelus australis]
MTSIHTRGGARIVDWAARKDIGAVGDCQGTRSAARPGAATSYLGAARPKWVVVVRLLASHLGEPDSIPGWFDSRWNRSRIIECGNRARRYRLSAGFFFGYLPFQPPLRSGAAPYSLRFTLIGSQRPRC